MKNYIYNDKEESMPTLSAMLTSRLGDGTSHHEAVYLDTINLLVAAFSSGSMIDIGAGRGRISEAAVGKIREIVALEPDPGRCNWTRELLAEHNSVSVESLMTQDYIAKNPGKQFDLTVLGMVVQHLPTYAATAILEDVATLTRSGGIAIASTTHAIEKAKCFTYQHSADARISEDEFNAYAANTSAQDKGLPVHRFSRSEFEALVPESFEIVQWSQFSYYRPEYLQRFAETHQVEPEDLTNVGNSQFLILKKK